MIKWLQSQKVRRRHIRGLKAHLTAYHVPVGRIGAQLCRHSLAITETAALRL